MSSNNILDDDEVLNLSARSYQTEIVEQAKSENLIVCLPTGSGKTFIAIMLIKELSPAIRSSLQNGGKRTILLVKTVELGRQHLNTLNKHLRFQIKMSGGSSKSNLQNVSRCSKEFEDNQILIFTAQSFLNLLDHNLFSLDKVNLLIFDECHHASGDDPYAQIMRKHYNECPHRPRILGLTASITVQKLEPEKLQKVARELEKIFQSRIETGSDRIEILRSSTSVKVDPQRCLNYAETMAKDKTVMNIFKTVKSLFDELNKYIKTKKTEQVQSETDSSKTSGQSNIIQLQCRTLDQLKSHLDNIIHIGYDLGLYGFSLGITSLRNYLKSKNTAITIFDQREKALYDNIVTTLDSLINDHFENLSENRKILYSEKVTRAESFIRKNIGGQCIVFVERVYTAAFLCQVLRKMVGTSIKIEYLAGSKAYIDGITVSDKYRRRVVTEFDEKDINVLISTAIVEEGLDVAGCNLVIRFNKPQNFSSYMQSKGRARAGQGNASFVLLGDESNFEEFSKTKEEYRNYEDMEKMLKRNFKTDFDTDSSSDEDVNSLILYQPGNGVKIDGIRAIQIINQYCAVLGNGQILSPRFLFSVNEFQIFKCVLSMPSNCPIREDIICENKNKKLAKQECCLKMVELLHKKEELDERCLPIRPVQYLTMADEQEKERIEMIEKQISHFPQECVGLSPGWYLYRIDVSKNNDLGFIVPYELSKLPMFNLYGRDGELKVEISYLKRIDFKQYEDQLKAFCRYLFEDVFDDMITGSESILKFDMEYSTFKLLPCLLNKSDDIDVQRIETICDRKNKLIRNPSDLSDNELYYASHLAKKQFYTNISDVSLLKRAGDQWEHKRPSETVESYADYFEYTVPNINIQRHLQMATMKDFRKLRRNYLTDSLLKKEKESNTPLTKPVYYPIELLRYAPLNQADFELIYKLPSILVRLSQLYHIEQLRKLLAENIQSYRLLDVDSMSIVTFDDCLTNIFSQTRSSALPLVTFDYSMLSENNCVRQPSPGLLFQSITRRSAAEKTDMENLEILGDCFLKLGMSMSLYHQYPSNGSGKLTSEKDRQVSNANLYRLATKTDLKKYINFNKVTYGGAEANWIPPGFIVNEENADGYTKQKAKRKAFADMMEGLIGAFLVSTDYSTTIRFMKWLGLGTIPLDEQNQIMKTPSVLHLGLSDTMDNVKSGIEKYYIDQAFADVEQEINYVFKDKAYLISAFTHASYRNNNFTQCYERLEYLGDAVLDFLVIRCIFVEHYDKVTPNRVTDIRQDLANNGRLAKIFVSCKLHKKILHSSPDLFTQLTLYLKDETVFSKEKIINDIDQWADSTAPKALADVFEALVGAIFLDSGYSLATVWKVVEPLLRQYINQSIEHPNLNPVRSFFEHRGKLIDESTDGKGKFICIAKLPNEEEFKGHGKNKKLAKYDACRKAMSSL